jgi:hypothetical protein
MFLGWLRTQTRHAMRETQRTSKPAGRHATFRPRLEALERRDLPSTLTVLNNLDSGAGSLRAEIAAAKSKDTIVFAPSLAGQTINLTSGELLIQKNLTIAGPGAGQLTVSGGGNSQVFEVAARAKVTMSGLTISNGSAIGLNGGPELGGGILNHGTLTVSGCTLSSNHALYGGGIANFGGTLTVSGCTLSGNDGGFAGGGIWNGGTLTVSGSTIGSSVDPITGSTLPGNYSYEGGGIYNLGNANVSNSTLSSNNATLGDQGSGNGGGIYNDRNAKLTVSNCTLSSDTAGLLGGGIYNAGTLTVSNSVVSSNYAAGYPNIYGPYTDGGGNRFT